MWFFSMGGFHLVRDRDGAIDVDQIPLDLSQRGLVSKTMQDNFYQDKHLKNLLKEDKTPTPSLNMNLSCLGIRPLKISEI